jgi:hypothetical protein
MFPHRRLTLSFIYPKELLQTLGDAEARVSENESETVFEDDVAVSLASEYRARRRALLEGIA